MTGWFWDWLFIITLTVFILKLILQGDVPLEFGTLAIIALVAIRALGRGLGGGIGQVVRKTFTIALPIVTAVTIAITYSKGEITHMVALLVVLGALSLMLLALYIMIRGLFT
jgi:hypothetical protein